MASIRKEFDVGASPAQAWDAIRDIGALHERLVPGFVTATRRLAWSASGGQLIHHNASIQVFEGPRGGSRLVWTADLLPDAMRAPIEAMIDDGVAAMRTALAGG